MTPPLVQSRYVLGDMLGQGSMGVVYACTDRLTGHALALKRIYPARTHRLTQTYRLALIHEFQMLASLRHANIIRVRELGFDEDQGAFFTMDLMRDAQTVLEAGRAGGLDVRVDLFGQLLRGLVYLERRGIAHRDLKPTNALVEGGTLRILDFGLSALREELDQHPNAGTMAYLAPEIFQEQFGAAAGSSSTSARADLYAVGVMAYELFAGQHPYDLTSMATLMRDLRDGSPDLTRLQGPEALRVVIGRLLSREPAQRYGTPTEALEALAAAGDQGAPVVIETDDARESILQAARLVGREGQQAELERVLDRMARDEAGCVTLLIGGESGVGKTRLLQEARVLAMVRGFWVFTGDAVQDNHAPYEVWHRVLLRLAMQCAPSPLEAGVLAEIVPGLAEVLGAPLSAPPQIDPKDAAQRIVKVVQALLARLDRPLVVLLEDLQWMTSEEVALFQALAAGTYPHPVLWAGTFRNDERPELVEALACDVHMALERLDPGGVDTLCRAMVGGERVAPKLMAFLRDETQGNPFFIVETLRELAESAGRLAHIDADALPERVFPRGMRQLVERRLSRIPNAYRAVMKAAALTGRVFDVALLARLGLDDDSALTDGLETCARYALIEPYGERWRFTHDKLREGLLAQIEPAEQRDLHRRLAEAIERGSDAPDREAVALAYHWGGAGDTARQAHYSGIAGGQALAQAAYSDAIAYLEHALSAAAQTDPFTRARWQRQLGQAQIGLGQVASGQRSIEAAMEALGFPPPRTPGAQVQALIRELGVQVARRWGVAPPSKAPERVLLAGVRGYDRLGEAYFFAADQGALLHSALKALNLAESIGRPTPELAIAYANIHGVMGLIPWRSQAEVYARAALETAEATGDPAALLWALWLTSNYRLAAGQWPLALAGFRRQRDLSEQIGYQRHWEIAIGSLFWIAVFQGRFQDASALILDWVDSTMRGDVQTQSWACHGALYMHLREGRLDEARAVAERATALLERDPGPESVIGTLALCAHLELKAGALDRAQRLIDQALAVDMGRPMAFFAMYAFDALCTVQATLAARGVCADPIPGLKRAERGLTSMRSAFPITGPAAHRARGARLAFSKRASPARAREAFHASRAEAARLGMPVEAERTTQMEAMVLTDR